MPKVSSLLLRLSVTCKRFGGYCTAQPGPPLIQEKHLTPFNPPKSQRRLLARNILDNLSPQQAESKGTFVVGRMDVQAHLLSISNEQDT